MGNAVGIEISTEEIDEIWKKLGGSTVPGKKIVPLIKSLCKKHGVDDISSAIDPRTYYTRGQIELLMGEHLEKDALSQSINTKIESIEEMKTMSDAQLFECSLRCCNGSPPLPEYDSYTQKGMNLPFEEGQTPDTKDVPLVEGLGSFEAPERLDSGRTLNDTRVSADDPQGVTLYVCYGQRRSDWKYIKELAKGKNHNLRFVPQGAPLEAYRVSSATKNENLRTLLEAKNNMSIYFHRWASPGHAIPFKDGDIVQTERKAWRRHD